MGCAGRVWIYEKSVLKEKYRIGLENFTHINLYPDMSSCVGYTMIHLKRDSFPALHMGKVFFSQNNELLDYYMETCKLMDQIK